MKKLLLFICCFHFILASPSRKIPPSMLDEFTENGKILVYDRYVNSSRSSKAPDDWSEEKIISYIGKIRSKQTNIFEKTDIWLSLAFSKYTPYIENKETLVLSAIKPWYAALVLENGGIPISIEYLLPKNIHPEIKIFTVNEYKNDRQKFDAIVSISTIQHDGLGRFNDTLNGKGDFLAMDTFKKMLNPGGVLFLSVPVCKDSISFNAYRTYGKIRLPLLLKGWKILDSFGFDESNYNVHPKKGFRHQPVFVLTPE